MKSSFLSLNTQDYLRGLIVSVLSAVVTIMYQSVQAGDFVFDFKSIAKVGFAAALGYIVKNLVTNSQDQFLKKEAAPEV
jgi:hypothetical protein